MPDPVSPAVAAGTATIIAAGALGPAVVTVASAAAPELVIFGVALGLRADILFAGFCGSVVAIAFFNAVPPTGDTWRELLRTTARRMGYAFASAVTAGYLTPVAALLERPTLPIPAQLLWGLAFVTGAGAQKILARFIKRAEERVAPSDAKEEGGNAA